ncbi:aldehyde:ferredoxin oxidoreductase [Clostridiales bacterium PH28_bin88]|nr:aldehyde:ferredoxin oxidoreductase [Clostridiales bacterium PH28_bin88]
MGRVLKVDLSKKETSEYPWSDRDRELYLGGKIMAARILYDNVGTGTDPLLPDNFLVVSTGPLTGTGAPCSSRFNISALSPLTGFIASSNCGGNFGIYLKKAGYDGLVITGKSEEPTWIEITERDVVFHDAKNLWGKTTGETQQGLGDKCGKIVIGPAGENLVRYASIFSEERAAGRAGVGAVMGSKNLKAVVARGNQRIKVNDKEKTKHVFKDWVNHLLSHPITGNKLPRFGTAYLLRGMNANKMLATRNFKHGQFMGFEKLTGEYIREKLLVKNRGCATCPIKCGRVVEMGGKLVRGAELETLIFLGPNIENDDPQQIIGWNYLLDELGLDTMSAANTVAFAMELNENGLWDNGLEFGQTGNLAVVFQDIAYRRGVGDLLAEGTKRLSELFGGREYAIHSKGLELAGYEPRGVVGHGLGYAVANRGGCHLNGGFLAILEGLGLSMDPYTPKSKAALTILQQDLLEAISAGGSCLFTTFSLLPGMLVSKPNGMPARLVNTLLKYSGWFVNMINQSSLPFHLPGLPHTRALSGVTGMNIHLGKLKEIGERGYNLERLFNIRMGLTGADDTLPSRLTDDPQDPDDPRTRVPLERMKKEYYRLRGWTEYGIPAENKLRKLGI